MYSESILNRFLKPENLGGIKCADGQGICKSKEYGDTIKVFIKVENDKIVNAKFKIFGSIIAVCCADVAMNLIKDKTLKEAIKITAEEIISEIEDFPEDKKYCAELVKDAIFVTIDKYQKKMKKLEEEKKETN